MVNDFRYLCKEIVYGLMRSIEEPTLNLKDTVSNFHRIRNSH